MSIPAAYIGVILIWSTTPLAIQWSGDDVGWLFGVTTRMCIGVLTGLMVALLFRISLPWHIAARRTYLAAGLGMFCAMTLVYWSARYIPSGWISVLFGIAPIMTGVMAHVWLRENALSPARITGLLLGIGGLAIMLIGSRSLGPGAALGMAGMLLSVLAYSASAIAIKHIGADIPALATTIGGLAITAPLLLLMYAYTGEPLPTHVPLRTALSIAYLGTVGSVLGFAMYYYVLHNVEATRVALITLITPVIALVLGNMLNGEAIQAEVWIGTTTILTGLLLFEYGKRMNGWKLRLQELLVRRSPAP